MTSFGQMVVNMTTFVNTGWNGAITWYLWKIGADIEELKEIVVDSTMNVEEIQNMSENVDKLNMQMIDTRESIDTISLEIKQHKKVERELSAIKERITVFEDQLTFIVRALKNNDIDVEEISSKRRKSKKSKNGSSASRSSLSKDLNLFA